MSVSDGFIELVFEVRLRLGWIGEDFISDAIEELVGS
jgi:hypothetical protein